MDRIRTLVILFSILFFQNSVHALFVMENGLQEQDTSKVVKKESKAVGFFKKLFRHSDSAKRAKKFIHQHHKLLKDAKKVTFAKGVDSATVKKSFFETDDNVELEYEVFGWYPYWEKNYYENINFSLLSTVAYFSYEVNPSTGNAVSVHDWETTGLIDSIRNYSNKRILLTVSNFGERNNRRFLRNPKAVDQLISNLIALLSKRNADGVCIDFEGVQKKEKDNYTGFLISLSNRLKAANRAYKVYMTVPSVDFSKSLDFKNLTKVVDKFVIMGYDYYGKTSTIAGPVSPLQSGKDWEPFNLETSVNYYLDQNVLGSKLLLALPTYGSLWETENQSLQSKAKKYLGARTYSYIKSYIDKDIPSYIEPISKSAYSTYRVTDGKTTYRQCWFENDSTFTYKIGLIKEKKLAGLGIWALGYDKGYDDFWKVINKEMTISKENTGSTTSTTGKTGGSGSGSTANTGSIPENGTIKGIDTTNTSIIPDISKILGLADPESKINQVEEKLPSIADYKYVLLYTLSFVLFFGCAGFFAAMLFPNTRAIFFNDTSLRNYYMIIMLVLIIVVIRMFGLINDMIVVLILGFILGGGAFYIANKIVERTKQDLP